MKLLVIFLAVAYQPCTSRTLPEDSVVSVYTTQPTTAGTHPPFDVYHQIANNIAERITSPIYKLLGIGKNKTEDENKAAKKAWEHIELLDEPEEATQSNYVPVDNDISKDRDVEELSVEALKKPEKRPEKIVLYSSYLPVLGKLETFEEDNSNNTVTNVGKNNDTDTNARRNDVDDDDDDDGLTLDDVEQEEAREGFFIHILEVLGSIVQLVYGYFSGFFKPKLSDNSN